MLKTEENSLTKSKRNIKLISVVSAFIICFIYGALLLMIGYTQGGLKHAIWPNNPNAGDSIFTYLLLGQSLGLITMTLSLKWLLKKFNVRWILSIGYLCAIGALLGISQIDKITNDTSTTGGIVCFIIFSYLLGVFIGGSSPIASTYLSAVYKKKKRETMLSCSNGVYGIGAGIIPLALSNVIYNLSTTETTFTHVRYFYYIAMGLAIVGAIVGFMINYKHTTQQTSASIINKKTSKNFSLLIPLGLIIGIMSSYMIAETISNYMFVNTASHFAANGKTASKQIKIQISIAFGLFVLVQGLWRTICGLSITKMVSNHYYILLSSFFIIAGFIAMLAGAFSPSNYKWGIYVVAILMAIGLGNCWPIIFSYGVSLDNRRSTFIGIIINIVSMAWIPLAQLLCAVILLLGNGIGYNIILALGLVVSVLIIVALLITKTTLKKYHIKGDVELKTVKAINDK